MIPDRLIKPVLFWWNALIGARVNRRQIERDRKRELLTALSESLAKDTEYPGSVSF